MYKLQQKYNQYFSVITFWMVLEHILNPGSAIRDSVKLLKVGGYLAGSVPNVNGIGVKIQGLRRWYLTVPPEHLNYFNRTSLEWMLKKAGLTPKFIGTVSLYAMPYIVFGIRKRIITCSNRVNHKFLKSVLLGLHRLLTLFKRYFIYKPFNFLIIFLKIEGNSIFFVAKKTNNDWSQSIS